MMARRLSGRSRAARLSGSCGLAPVIMIDDDVHQRVKPARLAKILDRYRETEAPAVNGENED